jgi:uncharacterized protein with HEPN domain
MPRDYEIYLKDILEAIAKIRDYTSGFSFEDFADDPKTRDAVVRNLEVIGEAVKKIPPEVRLRAPEVEWKRMAGLRDVLIHEYFRIDQEIIWDLVQNRLPIFKEQVRQLLGE